MVEVCFQGKDLDDPSRANEGSEGPISAADRINLVPQAATRNNGPWKAIENEFKVALDARKTLLIKIDVGYQLGGVGLVSLWLPQ